MQKSTTFPVSLSKKLFLTKAQQIAFILLLFLLVIEVLTVTYADPDLWGHLRFGLDFLRAGTISQSDPYSYLSEGQPWINHEWLAEVLFALAWTTGGANGLILLKVVIGVLTLAVFYVFVRRFSGNTLRLSILVLFTFSILLPFFSPVRPQLFTMLLFSLTLFILIKAEFGFYRWLWMLAPLFALWVNMHGAFLAGLGTLGIWVVLHRPVHARVWRQILPPVLLSFLAILANPYKIDLMFFLLRTATVPRPEIADWQPVQIMSIYGIIYLILLIVSVSSIIFSRRERRVSLVILFFILAILPLQSVRHLQLFAPAALILTGEHILSAWSQLRQDQQSHVSPWFHTICNIGILITLILMVLYLDQGIQISKKTPLPRSTVSLLKGSGIAGNMAVPFNWGEYVLWHLGPRVKVSVDGRRETVYSDDVYRQNISFMLGVGRWDAILTDYETDLALVEKGSPPYNLLSLKDDWSLIYEDDVSSLFVRENSDLRYSLQEYARTFIPVNNSQSFP